MPPKKRALSNVTADANAQPAPKRDRKCTECAEEEPKQLPMPELPPDHIENRPPYTYICIGQPQYIKPLDHDSDAESDSEEEKLNPSIWNTLASEHPEHKYTMMAGSWCRFVDYVRLGNYANPDNFDMHIYNDTHGYGLVELMERLFIEFNKAYRAKDVEGMWSVAASLGHWLNHHSVINEWVNIDDADGVCAVAELIGVALLTALEAIDRMGELKVGSKFLDLGLVMTLHLQWSIFPAEIPLEEGLEWREQVVAYGKRAGIELSKIGCDESVLDVWQEFDNVPALEKGKGTGDRWEWAKKFKEMKQARYPIFGLEQHNICLMSRKERASYHFDGIDPLKDWSEKDLKEGNLTILNR